MLVHKPVCNWHLTELFSSKLRLVCWRICYQPKTAVTMSFYTRKPNRMLVAVFPTDLSKHCFCHLLCKSALASNGRGSIIVNQSYNRSGLKKSWDLYLAKLRSLTERIRLQAAHVSTLFHKNYMVVLGNEHMTVDLKRSSTVAIESLSEGFRCVMCSHHNCPIELRDSWRWEYRISSQHLK